jgi:exosortase family protein XrtG
MPVWLGLIATVVWLLMALFFRVNRIWLPYYVVGTVGFALLLIFFGLQATPLSEWTQMASVWSVHHLSSLVNIPTQVFAAEEDALLVLVISQDIGWTMLQVSIESSAILESCVLVSMVVFYPGWEARKKARLVLIGVAATFAANVVRLMIITATLHYLGKESLLISHAVVGRFVFFILVVLIFWLIITFPTLRSVRQKLSQEARQ